MNRRLRIARGVLYGTISSVLTASIGAIEGAINGFRDGYRGGVRDPEPPTPPPPSAPEPPPTPPRATIGSIGALQVLSVFFTRRTELSDLYEFDDPAWVRLRSDIELFRSDEEALAWLEWLAEDVEAGRWMAHLRRIYRLSPSARHQPPVSPSPLPPCTNAPTAWERLDHDEDG